MEKNKQGYKTTEFWVTVITAAATFVSALAGALPEKQAAYVTAAIAAFYAVSRGLAKSGS